MDITTLGLLLLGAVVAFVALRHAREDLSRDVLPEDVGRLEAYYQPRGFKVLAVRRKGSIRTRSMRRDGRLRTYEVDLELPDGRRETRLRGVARSEAAGHQLWRISADGRPEQMF